MSLPTLSRHGHPLLYLPRNARAATLTLDLYPAQTLPARILRTVLQWVCKAGIVPPLPQQEAPFPLDGEFSDFLQSLCSTNTPVQVGILAGNPNVDGRRFICLVFAGEEPVCVVKVGVDEPARVKIREEAEALEGIHSRTRLAPALLGRFESETLSAIAIEQIPGKSCVAGTADSTTQLAAVLTEWTGTNTPLQPLGEFPQIRRLAEATNGFSNLPGGRELWGQCLAIPVRQVLYHGDFAPWNVRVLPDGSWKILDWERGEVSGPPGWDWFHWILQSGLLAKKLSASQVYDLLMETLRSPEFQNYAERVEIIGSEDLLLSAYLHYVIHVLKPAEGTSELQALEELTTQNLPAQ